MKKYVVTARAAGFGPGQLLGLSEEQLAARAHRLTPLDKNDRRLEAAKAPKGAIVCHVDRRVEFKEAEEIYVDPAEVPKALLAEVAPEDSAEATAAKERQAERQTKGKQVNETRAKKVANAEAARRQRKQAPKSKAKPKAKAESKPAALAEETSAADMKDQRPPKDDGGEGSGLI